MVSGNLAHIKNVFFKFQDKTDLFFKVITCDTSNYSIIQVFIYKCELTF